MISLPTKGLNKEERNALQSFIVKMDQDGYLDKAISMAPGSRFTFLNSVIDKQNLGTFVLVNERVPLFYGTKALNVTPVIIESNNGKVTIRSDGTHLVNPDNLPSYGISESAVTPHIEGCNCGHC